jgi:hypothetical protein
VVKEHQDALSGIVPGEWQDQINEEEIIDAEYRVEE